VPPTDLFVLGPPDLPIESIEVKTNQKTSFKVVFWSYPYKRLSGAAGGLFCKSEEGEGVELYMKQRDSIMNGTQSKEVFDCKRGLQGHVDGDISHANVWPVRPGSYGEEHYRALCLRVTHEKPYSPE
jgi:hypothetical protein